MQNVAESSLPPNVILTGESLQKDQAETDGDIFLTSLLSSAFALDLHRKYVGLSRPVPWDRTVEKLHFLEQLGTYYLHNELIVN